MTLLLPYVRVVSTKRRRPRQQRKALDGPTPDKPSSNLDENGAELLEELPSKLAVIYEKTAGRFVSFKALLVIVTALWLWQSFLWGGMYMGCGLAVAFSVAVMAGLVIRDYLSQGSMVSRLVGEGGGDEGRGERGEARPQEGWRGGDGHLVLGLFLPFSRKHRTWLLVDAATCFTILCGWAPV